MSIAIKDEKKILHCRMTEAMDALCQMRKSKAPVTCQHATGLTGVSGASVVARIVVKLAP